MKNSFNFFISKLKLIIFKLKFIFFALFLAVVAGLTVVFQLYGQTSSATGVSGVTSAGQVRKTSTISGPLYYSIASLEKSLNRRFTNLLYKDETYFNNENDGVIAYAVKAGDIAVSIEENGIVKTRVPMTIKVNYRAFYPIIISFLFFKQSIIIDEEQEFIFDIIVHFNSKAEMQEDLSVVGTTTYKIDWITMPYIVLYKFFKFKLHSQVEDVFNKVFEGYSKKIDSVIASQFAPQLYIQKIVNLFNAPIKIDDDSNLYVKVALVPPIKVSPVKLLNKKYITLDIETKSMVDLFFDNGNNTNVEKILPNTSLQKIRTQRINEAQPLMYLDMHAYVSTGALTKFVTQRIGSSPMIIETGKLKAAITEIYFSRSNEKDSNLQNKLVADVFLRNIDKNGNYGTQFQIKVFFIPVFNSTTGVLSVTGVEYKLNSESLLLSFASLVASKTFKSALEREITVSISSYIENLKKVLAEKVKNRRLTKNLSIRAKINEVAVNSIVMKGENIEIDFAITGDVKFYLDNLF